MHVYMYIIYLLKILQRVYKAPNGTNGNYNNKKKLNSKCESIKLIAKITNTQTQPKVQ